MGGGGTAAELTGSAGLSEFCITAPPEEDATDSSGVAEDEEHEDEDEEADEEEEEEGEKEDETRH